MFSESTLLSKIKLLSTSKLPPFITVKDLTLASNTWFLPEEVTSIKDCVSEYPAPALITFTSTNRWFSITGRKTQPVPELVGSIIFKLGIE